MFNVGSAIGYLMLDTSNFTSSLKSAAGDIKTFQDKSTTTADKFTAMGSALTSVGSSLTKNVSLPLIGLGTTVTAVAAKFESSMSSVAAIAGLDTAGKEFDRLSEKAKEMGAKTKFSASEAADAFTYMAMAGWKTEDMLDGIEGVMNLAAASGEDLALTSDIVTDALTAFGLTAKDSAHFADVLAAASNNANTNVSLLGESFKYVAPVAGALNFSAEDTSIALGLMANSGIKASQAGTVLRTAISNLVSPTNDMKSIMDEYNISLTDSDGNMKSLMDIMTDLRTNMGGLDEATQAAAASTLFGKEAMSGMLAVINASDSDFDKLTKAIYNADGTANSMADTMQNNLSGQLTILKSGLEGLAIFFGEILIPELVKLVQWITSIVNKFNSMNEGTKRIIVVIGMAAAAVGPILLVLGKVSGAIGSIINLISGIGGLSSALTLLSGPIGIVIAAVAALAAAWATDFGGIREATSEIFESIKTIISTVWGFISTLWDENFMNIKEIATTVWEDIELIFGTAFDVISNAFQIFAAIFSGDWETAWTLVKDTASEVWETIKTLFNDYLNTIVSTLKNIGSSLWQTAKEVFNRIKDGFTEVWDSIKSWFSNTIKDIVSTVKGIGESLFKAGKGVFERLWDGLKNKWQGIKDWVSNAVDWIVSKVKFWEKQSDKVNSGEAGGSVASRGSYASGLDYVPRDMYVKVHEGEAILTKEENSNRSYSGSTFGDITINIEGANYSNEESLARAMANELQILADRKGAVWG